MLPYSHPKVGQVVGCASDGELDELCRCAGEIPTFDVLILHGAVTNEGMARIRSFERYPTESVNVLGTKITDTGLKHLAWWRGLKSLCINTCTTITDDGLECLQAMDDLLYLSLLNEGSGPFMTITDSGLKHLEGLSNLREVDLVRTQVASAGVNSLKEALPDCIVRRK